MSPGRVPPSKATLIRADVRSSLVVRVLRSSKVVGYTTPSESLADLFPICCVTISNMIY